MQKDASNLKSKKIISKKLLVPGSIGVFLLFTYLTISVFIPTFIGNGLTKYSGAKYEIAKKVLDFEYHNSFNKELQKLHVDDVRPITQDERNMYCEGSQFFTSDSSKPNYYAVVLRSQMLFGITSRSLVRYGCEPLLQVEG